MSGPVFFYVQHLLGIGHLRRAAVIARALRRQSLGIVFVSGGEPVRDLDLAGADLVQLPPAYAADEKFSAIHDEAGKPIDDAWRARRREQLLAEFDRRRPGLLLVEMFPFGRRQFAFELEPLMSRAQRQGIPVLISLRDILVAKSKASRVAETVALVNRLADGVLVHGDPNVARLEATFPAAAELRPPILYTGYVAEVALPARAEEGPEILVSAGGGAVGLPLLSTVLEAMPKTAAATAPWRLISGPNLGESEFRTLANRLAANVRLERFRSDFPALMAAARLSISQAGYNTVMDILCTGVRALVLPFGEGGESEQTMRARLLAERGLLSVMEPPFEAGALAQAIDGALARERPAAARIDLGGADTTARLIAGRLAP
jgi:predicted glycosyltransferase